MFWRAQFLFNSRRIIAMIFGARPLTPSRHSSGTTNLPALFRHKSGSCWRPNLPTPCQMSCFHVTRLLDRSSVIRFFLSPNIPHSSVTLFNPHTKVGPSCRFSWSVWLPQRCPSLVFAKPGRWKESSFSPLHAGPRVLESITF